MMKYINFRFINMEITTSPFYTKSIIKIQTKKDGPQLTLRSDFDSGNMMKAQVGPNCSIMITTANDCLGTIYESRSRGWFYFAIRGFTNQMKQKFIVKQMTPLSYYLKSHEYFKPVYRASGNEQWQRVEQAVVFTRQDDTQLHFDFTFGKQQEVFFAYSFPFGVEDCNKMLKQCEKEAKNMSKQIYYKEQVMTFSPQGRPVHMITLSSHDNKLQEKQQIDDEILFPDNQRPKQFDKNKQIAIITARVHPGEAPASHTFYGLIKYLLSKDARAFFLRKKFVFKMVPMLNPDGVYLGHHRMDCFGNNLNRYYLNPHPQKQPAIYAVKRIGQYYSKRGIFFYMDLHSHPQKKGNFIYGNSLQIPKEQIETQTFAKILSLNCPEFDYAASSFSKQQMNSKDKNQDLTKEGCGRVVFGTHLKALYAYTLECGFTASSYINDLVPIHNAHRKFQKLSIESDQLENLKSAYYNKKSINFTTKTFRNLDLISENPASRLPNTSFKDLQGIKKDVWEQILKQNIGSSQTYSNNNISNRLQGRGIFSKKVIFKRAPSISSNKALQFNKTRNKTISKVNIGLG